ncbi:Remorin, C-terminal [Trema orientale]|uniref:Remorin, C-terminal n=1 Tax=Trema orientale TaxID=63057 RepID=A0A2P5CIT5_TREOI|nr:Remorin, C-terminal [Trema orientale]
MRGRAHDKLMNKLAAARHKAEEKRAAAEAKRNQQAAKTEQQAEYIRRTAGVEVGVRLGNSFLASESSGSNNFSVLSIPPPHSPELDGHGGGWVLNLI